MEARIMIRMQVQFDADEAKALRRAATQRGVSISAVVRDAVDRCVLDHDERDDANARANAASGTFSSGSGDVAARHDDYFVQSAEE
jgi:hypothetical protein